MKENEFDISVRNLLEDAEMPVSPKVWKGVEASLGSTRRFVLPFWAYALAGAAAAAAVAVGVFIHRPAGVVPSEQNLVAEAPQIHAEPVDATIAIPIEKQIETLPKAAVARQEIVPVAIETEETPLLADEMVVKREVPTLVKASLPVALSVSDDNAALNQLAFSERKASTQGLALGASGDLQNNNRKAFSRTGIMAPRAPQTPNGEGIYNASPEVGFGLPFALGINAKYYFSEHLSVSAGLRYTGLSRTFVGDYYDADEFPYLQTDIDNYQHWLGVPVNVYFDMVSSRYWRFHTFLGGGVDFLLDNNYRVHATPSDINYHDNSYPPMFSIAGGFGMEFKMSDKVGLYFDPSIRYYFNTSKAPRSIRTVQPLCIDLEAGLRFYL